MSRQFIYLLQIRNPDGFQMPRYDYIDSLVVRAESAYEARKLANEKPGAEGAIWEDPDLTSCRRLGEVTPGARTKPGVVCESFNAG